MNMSKGKYIETLLMELWKKDQEIDRRSSDRFRNSPVVAGGQKVRGIERHRHMFNRKGEMTYVIT